MIGVGCYLNGELFEVCWWDGQKLNEEGFEEEKRRKGWRKEIASKERQKDKTRQGRRM